MNTTTENNKLIAEFMGMQLTSLGWFDNEETLLKVERDNTFDRLEFHYNWNWLMEVIHKIEGLNYYVIVLHSNVEITSSDTDFKTIFGYSNNFSKIEAVYNAVVAFIEWYNSAEKEN